MNYRTILKFTHSANYLWVIVWERITIFCFPGEYGKDQWILVMGMWGINFASQNQPNLWGLGLLSSHINLEWLKAKFCVKNLQDFDSISYPDTIRCFCLLVVGVFTLLLVFTCLVRVPRLYVQSQMGIGPLLRFGPFLILGLFKFGPSNINEMGFPYESLRSDFEARKLKRVVSCNNQITPLRPS